MNEIENTTRSMWSVAIATIIINNEVEKKVTGNNSTWTSTSYEMKLKGEDTTMHMPLSLNCKL